MTTGGVVEGGGGAAKKKALKRLLFNLEPGLQNWGPPKMGVSCCLCHRLELPPGGGFPGANVQFAADAPAYQVGLLCLHSLSLFAHIPTRLSLFIYFSYFPTFCFSFYRLLVLSACAEDESIC